MAMRTTKIEYKYTREQIQEMGSGVLFRGQGWRGSDLYWWKLDTDIKYFDGAEPKDNRGTALRISDYNCLFAIKGRGTYASEQLIVLL